MDFTATQTAELTGISWRSANAIYALLRLKVQQWVHKQAPFNGIVALDESYFGLRRVPGKRGRGHRGNPSYSEYSNVMATCTPKWSLMHPKKTLQVMIRGKVAFESLLHSDGWRGYYNGRVDVGYDTHYRVHHGNDEFARGSAHINGIESFWSYAKRRRARFNGIRHTHFILHLKETEFRFNYRNNDLYSVML